MNYFDLQVNGYAGVDFNQDGLLIEDMHLACEVLAAHGVSILATIITEQTDRMADRLRAIVRMREADPLIADVVRGFHIEGPFINPAPGYRGAHRSEAVRLADVPSMQRLLDAAAGLARIITLAPECDPGLHVTRMLADHNVTVSAGHCDPTLDELDAAIDAGLTMFTHVGNGCPAELPRHDNIIQRVLSRADRLWLCFIADGVHVPLFVLGNYLRIAGLDRCVVVSDAIAPAGLGPGRFTLGHWALNIGRDLVARSPDGSHLVGSAMNLPQAAAHLADLGLSARQIAMLMHDNPVRAIGGLTDVDAVADRTVLPSEK